MKLGSILWFVGFLAVGLSLPPSAAGDCPASAENIWINEIHYDNVGGDLDEAVEVAGDAGIDLSCYSLVFYNGNGGGAYNSELLTGALGDLGSGYGVANFSVAGIQNGAPDGVALVLDHTVVVQFLSYEGVFTAADGPAEGMESEDMGVAQQPPAEVGYTLQLTGRGTAYADFTWAAGVAATPGDVNLGQVIDDSPAGGPFRIFHMNDAHSRLLPHDFDIPARDDVPGLEPVGGAAFFGAKLLALKAAHPDSLILDAGDLSEGNPLGDLRGNGGMVDFYNLLDAKLKALGGRGIDAVVVGNHDVRSLEMLNNLLPAAEGGAARFKALSVNVCEEGTTTPYFDPYEIVTVNGAKVGILGYTNDASSHLGPTTEHVVDVVPCTWEGGAGKISIKSYVEELRVTHGCDVVVLLSHMGHSRVVSGADAVIADSGSVDPPEVVISGHWHAWTERVWRPSHLNGKTVIAEAGAYLQYIGEVAVTGDGEYIHAEKHVIRNADIMPDAEIAGLVEDLVDEYMGAGPAHGLHEVIGHSAVDLIMDKDKWWTLSEYPWSGANTAGAWICDAMVWAADQAGYPVHLAMQSGGGIRRDVAAGAITYVKIYETYPWSDDNMVRVQMSGQEIWDWIEADNVGTSISDGWHVTAHDGQISGITYGQSPIDLNGTYDVAISEYMYAHPVNPLSDAAPEEVGYGIREGVVDYTARFDSPANPMYPDGVSPRYTLNTEFAGGFRAVVTMIADVESQPYFEEAFIRFIDATPETLARRGGHGLSDLVKADGSINLYHRLSEIMLYRSHLGFPEDLLQNGDIIEVWGEGGFFEGTPEFIDQEGITATGDEIAYHGYDPRLARPEYHPSIASFFNDDHENHYVKLYAEKRGVSAVQDADGTPLTVYEPGGYYTKLLPGNIGDILELTGVTTQAGSSRRFRCDEAKIAADLPVVGYPPVSSVTPITPYHQPGPILLTAAASDHPGGSTGVTLAPAADAQVAEGYLGANYGSTTSMYVQSASGGAYQDERAWVRFELSGRIPPGAAISSAALRLYCWRADDGGDLDAAVHAGDDTWTEGGLTWSTQPAYDAAPLDVATLVRGVEDVWYEWDVTPFVTAKAAGDERVSLVVKPISEGSATYVTYAFDSKEYAAGAYAPQLVIAWAPVGGGSDQPAEVAFSYRYAPDGLSFGGWSPIGVDTTPADGWQMPFLFPDGQGSYEFMSVATDLDGNVEDAPVRADARAIYNSSPDAPGEPAIPERATNVSVNATLGVTVTDPNGGTLTVCFYRTASGDTVALIACQPERCCRWCFCRWTN